MVSVFSHKTHCKSLIHKQKRSVSNRVGCKHIRRPKIRMALSVWGREYELTWSEEPEGHILCLDWLIYMWFCGIKSDISWNRNIHPQLALNIYRYGQKTKNKPRMKADNSLNILNAKLWVGGFDCLVCVLLLQDLN